MSPREALDVLRAAIRARRGLVLGFGAAAFAATIALNAAAPYKAREVVALNPLDESPVLSRVGIPPPPPIRRQDLTSGAIRQRMIDDALVPQAETADALKDELHVELYLGTRAILVARGRSEQDALALAAAWTTALQRDRSDLLNAQVATVESRLLGELQTVKRERDGIPAQLERRDIRRQLARLRAARRKLPQEVQVVEAPATVRGGGITNELKALGLALGAGLLVAMVLELREGRLRTPAAARASFGAPVVGRAADRDAVSLSLNGAGRPATVLVTPSESLDRPDQPAVALTHALAGEDADAALVVWRDAASARALGVTAASERRDGSVLVVAEDCPPEQLVPRLASLRWSAGQIVVLARAITAEPSGLLIAHIADLWLVLVSLGRTRDAEARELLDELAPFDRRPDGLVLAGPGREGA